MPRPALKRKHAEAGPTPSISSYTRVQKSTITPIGKPATVISASKKRKSSTIEGEEVPTQLARRTISFPPSSDDEEGSSVKRTCRRTEGFAAAYGRTRAAPVPVKGKKVSKPSSTRKETAHRGIEDTVIAKSRREGRTIQTKLDTAFKKTRSGKNDRTATDGLPTHLVELVALHKAFLKTVALQFTHTGLDVPIDVSAITPHISRSWGKRQVTIEDIRRCIAIQSSERRNATSPFIISDYGHGRVCVELRKDQPIGSINEERLCRQFEENLRSLCIDKAQDDAMDVDIPLGSLSLSELPQATISTIHSLIAAHPSITKGQNALSALNNALAAKHAEKEAKRVAAVTAPLVNSDGTKMSLLDRLRYKELTKADGPTPPTGPELERRAALSKVPDVAATISMLSLSNPMSLPRQAFTMTVILEKLKDSMRTPISREEGAACVRLIADEVAPEWLRVVKIGGRENVVVQRVSQPVERVLQERVQRKLA